MAGIRHPEFIAELEDTNYPFTAQSTLSNGTDTFLEGTFLDAHLYAVEGTSRYHISKVIVTSDLLTIYIGDAANKERLVSEIPIPITTEVVRLLDVYGRSGGMLVSDPTRLSLLTAWGLGEHTFELGNAEFCVTCQMPVPNPGVTGIRLENGEVLSGKVWIIGEDGVVVRTEETTTPEGEVIEVLRVDIVGDPLYLQKLCTPESLFTPINPLRTIRIKQGAYEYDCIPDEQGNFNIQMNDSQVADPALRIRTTPEGIVVTMEGSTNVGT